MNANEFVKNCYKEKEIIKNIYFDKEEETLVGNLIKGLISKGIKEEEIKVLIDSVMTEAFYTMLLGLDGETSLGDTQMIYKLYDENDNLITGIKEEAYDIFMSKEEQDE